MPLKHKVPNVTHDQMLSLIDTLNTNLETQTEKKLINMKRRKESQESEKQKHLEKKQSKVKLLQTVKNAIKSGKKVDKDLNVLQRERKKEKVDSKPILEKKGKSVSFKIGKK
ncbi:hypothetical protein HK098_005172 [Nowakowskiella sp. JEL0407]|nr:hypothetical protein HK098_005172 [Nowakowskiella sp. JEL0407]